MKAFRVGQYVRVVRCPYAGKTKGHHGVVTALSRQYIRVAIPDQATGGRGRLYRPEELEPYTKTVSVPPMSDKEWHERFLRIVDRYVNATDHGVENYNRIERFQRHFTPHMSREATRAYYGAMMGLKEYS